MDLSIRILQEILSVSKKETAQTITPITQTPRGFVATYLSGTESVQQPSGDLQSQELVHRIASAGGSFTFTTSAKTLTRYEDVKGVKAETIGAMAMANMLFPNSRQLTEKESEIHRAAMRSLIKRRNK
jgi:hypothetical protein